MFLKHLRFVDFLMTRGGNLSPVILAVTNTVNFFFFFGQFAACAFFIFKNVCLVRQTPIKKSCFICVEYLFWLKLFQERGKSIVLPFIYTI